MIFIHCIFYFILLIKFNSTPEKLSFIAAPKLINMAGSSNKQMKTIKIGQVVEVYDTGDSFDVKMWNKVFEKGKVNPIHIKSDNKFSILRWFLESSNFISFLRLFL